MDYKSQLNEQIAKNRGIKKDVANIEIDESFEDLYDIIVRISIACEYMKNTVSDARHGDLYAKREALNEVRRRVNDITNYTSEDVRACVTYTEGLLNDYDMD